MPINVYTPSSDVIIKNTEVDFNCHLISSDVRITQYDDSLTILAIALYKDGVSYTLPTSLSAKLLMYRSDRIGISEVALGCDANRQVLYFAITREMSKLYGNVTLVVKLSNAANQVAASASFQMAIERNPIQDDGEVVDPSGNHIWPDSDKVVSVSGSTFASLVGTTTNIGYYTINDSSSVTYLSGDDYYLDSNGVAHLITEVQSLTWSALKALCDSSLLAPGKSYRITDYVCTTVQENTRSAGHPFDIIVVADTVNKLNERARAVRHEGGTYFANSKLEAWQVWYSLDNDTSRFAWADTANGKGVIYRMIDEFNNDCPYDFKNIQFIRKITDGALDLVGGVDTWVYTFTGFSHENLTLVDGTTLKASEYFSDEGSNLYKNNIIGVYEVCRFEEDGFDNILETLSGNVFIGSYTEVPYVEDGPAKTVLFSFNNNLGRDCYSNTFGYCRSNNLGNSCSYNNFGNDCNSNNFGNGCYSNTFGNSCSFNNFGTSCYYDAFGNSCNFNNLGNGCDFNNFGNSCSFNNFGNGCRYNKITGALNRISVDTGLGGASFANKLELYDSAIASKEYQISFKKASSGRYLMLWATDTGAMTGKYKALNTDATWTAL